MIPNSEVSIARYRSSAKERLRRLVHPLKAERGNVTAR
jgi:hypothetical protein